ncbi:MAG: cupin domain-containing protein [Thermomicrobiales bacterium]
MQRIILVAAMAMVALVGSAVTIRADVQEGADPLAGTTVEALGGGPSTLAADYNLVMLRITMEPGANIPAHSHPGEVVLFVESGTFGTAFVEGTGVITRATPPGTPAATEPVTAGPENILEAGNSLAYSEAAAHTMVNAGEDTLVLLVSAILAPDQPGFMFMDMSATPTP